MKKLKVLAVCGSPRKGNTEFMLQKVLESAKEHGAETELVLLRKKQIQHCDGCDLCWNYGKPCHIKDDMTQLYDKLINSDVIVVGTPNYFKNVSSMMKVFIDRTNSIVGKLKLKCKKAAIVCVGAQSFSNTKFCEKVMKQFIKDHKMKLIGSIIARANAPGEISKKKMVIKNCCKLGKKLAIMK